jgi:hypothetical protein
MILDPNDRNDHRLESAIAEGQRLAIPEPPDASGFLRERQQRSAKCNAACDRRKRGSRRCANVAARV